MNEESSQDTIFIICPTCTARFKRKKEQEKVHPLFFCAYCGTRLSTQKDAGAVEKSELYSGATIVTEHLPKQSEIQSTIGSYQILKRIGKGGMGEVFLAYDTVCGRKIALKRIRADLVDFPQIQKRFLHEARITSQLIHPAIIPIYSIDCEEGLIYYSMPYVAGSTLKQVLKLAREHEHKKSYKKEPHDSIPYLIRHFLQVCQAIAYAHSKGVLHRDVKPENIIVGTYGQVHILDWGLAKALNDEESELPNTKTSRPSITRLGKVVGTIAFMAPERALGTPATVQTDIYSLGVILYQILTLQYPFRRKSLESFKKHWMKEQFIPPEIMAPYRQVPEVLSQIARKCLEVDPKDRYKSVDEMIESLENYLEGRAEWLAIQTLDLNNKEDWLFQENILLAEHTAITQYLEAADWASVMISQNTFADNLKIEAKVRIKNKGRGIGFLFSVPETKDLRHFGDGYCLWIASEKETQKTTKLFHSSLSVFEAPQINLKEDAWYDVRIEKVDDRIWFYLNNSLQFSYSAHIPVIGARVGLLMRDADLDINELTIWGASANIRVSCLAVPDAFLARKMYDEALVEYARIGENFPGHQEGREALFRIGMTYLEQAKNAYFHKDRAKLLDQALDEFGKLRKTPGAPFEYLGKAYVYKENQEFEEEAKSFELALRRYKNHPLLPVIEEQIVFRMHESSKQNRLAAYYFIYLVARFIPSWAEATTSVKLFESLQKNWEIPFFMLYAKEPCDNELKRLTLCLGVAFWLAKPYVIAETIEDIVSRPIVAMGHLADGIFLLVLLGATELAISKMARIREVLSEAEAKRFSATLTLLEIAIDPKLGLEWLQTLNSQTITPEQERLIWYLLRTYLDRRDLALCKQLCTVLDEKGFSYNNAEMIDALRAEVFLYQEDITSLEKLFKAYPETRLMQESSLLYFPYGCYIAITQGIQSALTHFSKSLDVAFPRSWALAAHFLAGKIHMTPAGWFSRSFLWERRSLYEQLALFWHSAKDFEKQKSWERLVAREFVHE